MNKQYNSILLILLCFKLAAQLPDTDIWLFTLVKNKEGQTLPSKPLNITSRKGYDNQPSFSEDGKKIWYASVRDDRQADIYEYDIRKKKSLQITASPESEYSPALWPGGGCLSSVVVENDSAQRIHLIDLKTRATRKILENDSVGYCTFLNADSLVFFKLGQPHSLRFKGTDNREHWIGNSPARCFPALSRSSFLFALKDSASTIFFIYDLKLNKALELARLNKPCDDFTFNPIYGLVRSEDTRLLRYDKDTKKWETLFDLTGTGIRKISRFAFGPGCRHLAVVDNL